MPQLSLPTLPRRLPNLPQSAQRGPGRPRTQAPKIRSTVIVSDLHLPLIDWPSYRAVVHFIKDKRPDYLFLNGDIIDCAEQSRYEKSPAVFGQTEEELRLANEILDELQEASPTTIIKYIAGNHERRLAHRLYENPDLLSYLAPSGNPLEVLTIALNLDDRGIEFLDYPEAYNLYGFIITHGQATGQHPAKKEVERAGMPGCSGHCHRQRFWERKDRRGVVQWWSLGGLCSHDVDYIKNPDWVRGFGYLQQIVDSDDFTFASIPIITGKFLYDRVLYSQDGAFEAA